MTKIYTGTYPDGHLTKNYYYLYPGHNQINFYSDAVGQHILTALRH